MSLKVENRQKNLEQELSLLNFAESDYVKS